MMTTQTPLFSFWSGPVSWFEQLSVLSAVHAGHPVTVFSYDPPNPLLLEAGARVEDASQLWHLRSDSERDRLRKKPAHFSDHIRLEGLHQDRGTWIDLDCMLARPVPASDYVYARETSDPRAHIGNSVLRLPAGSPALIELLDFYRRRPFKPLPPHWAAAKRAGKWVEWQFDSAFKSSKIKTVPGPETLTGALMRHRLDHRAAPSQTFYPLSQTTAVLALLPGTAAASLINEDAILVHMWCKGGGLPGPLANSWLGGIATKVGMPLATPTDSVKTLTAELEKSTRIHLASKCRA